jgi:hypothetical protein
MFLPLTLSLLLNIATAETANDECPPSGGFVCGAKSAEDLVLVPDTNWIIASSFEPGAGIMLVDAKLKTLCEVRPLCNSVTSRRQ